MTGESRVDRLAGDATGGGPLGPATPPPAAPAPTGPSTAPSASASPVESGVAPVSVAVPASPVKVAAERFARRSAGAAADPVAALDADAEAATRVVSEEERRWGPPTPEVLAARAHVAAAVPATPPTTPTAGTSDGGISAAGAPTVPVTTRAAGPGVMGRIRQVGSDAIRVVNRKKLRPSKRQLVAVSLVAIVTVGGWQWAGQDTGGARNPDAPAGAVAPSKLGSLEQARELAAFLALPSTFGKVSDAAQESPSYQAGVFYAQRALLDKALAFAQQDREARVVILQAMADWSLKAKDARYAAEIYAHLSRVEDGERDSRVALAQYATAITLGRQARAAGGAAQTQAAANWFARADAAMGRIERKKAWREVEGKAWAAPVRDELAYALTTAQGLTPQGGPEFRRGYAAALRYVADVQTLTNAGTRVAQATAVLQRAEEQVMTRLASQPRPSPLRRVPR